MLVLSTGRCISWKISITVMVLGYEDLFPVLAFFFLWEKHNNFIGSGVKIQVTGNQHFFFKTYDFLKTGVHLHAHNLSLAWLFLQTSRASSSSRSELMPLYLGPPTIIQHTYALGFCLAVSLTLTAWQAEEWLLQTRNNNKSMQTRGHTTSRMYSAVSKHVHNTKGTAKRTSNH
jgi:hypothetical protein